jgi:hypothetical protein
LRRLLQVVEHVALIYELAHPELACPYADTPRLMSSSLWNTVVTAIVSGDDVDEVVRRAATHILDVGSAYISGPASMNAQNTILESINCTAILRNPRRRIFRSLAHQAPCGRGVSELETQRESRPHRHTHLRRRQRRYRVHQRHRIHGFALEEITLYFIYNTILLLSEY